MTKSDCESISSEITFMDALLDRLREIQLQCRGEGTASPRLVDAALKKRLEMIARKDSIDALKATIARVRDPGRRCSGCIVGVSTADVSHSPPPPYVDLRPQEDDRSHDE